MSITLLRSKSLRLRSATKKDDDQADAPRPSSKKEWSVNSFASRFGRGPVQPFSALRPSTAHQHGQLSRRSSFSDLAVSRSSVGGAADVVEAPPKARVDSAKCLSPGTDLLTCVEEVHSSPSMSHKSTFLPRTSSSKQSQSANAQITPEVGPSDHLEGPTSAGPTGTEQPKLKRWKSIKNLAGPMSLGTPRTEEPKLKGLKSFRTLPDVGTSVSLENLTSAEAPGMEQPKLKRWKSIKNLFGTKSRLAELAQLAPSPGDSGGPQDSWSGQNRPTTPQKFATMIWSDYAKAHSLSTRGADSPLPTTSSAPSRQRVNRSLPPLPRLPKFNERKGEFRGGHKYKPGATPIPVLDVDVPTSKMERYSVMFNGPLRSHSQPSLLSRRQSGNAHKVPPLPKDANNTIAQFKAEPDPPTPPRSEASYQLALFPPASPYAGPINPLRMHQPSKLQRSAMSPQPCSPSYMRKTFHRSIITLSEEVPILLDLSPDYELGDCDIPRVRVQIVDAPAPGGGGGAIATPTRSPSLDSRFSYDNNISIYDTAEAQVTRPWITSDDGQRSSPRDAPAQATRPTTSRDDAASQRSSSADPAPPTTLSPSTYACDRSTCCNRPGSDATDATSLSLSDELEPSIVVVSPKPASPPLQSPKSDRAQVGQVQLQVARQMSVMRATSTKRYLEPRKMQVVTRGDELLGEKKTMTPTVVEGSGHDVAEARKSLVAEVEVEEEL